MSHSLSTTLLLACSASAASGKRLNEVWTQAQTEANGLVHKGNHYSSPRPQDTLLTEELPKEFTWCDNDGVNYCTMNRNQHIPQYCGSCWAHGAVSALGDRIKIARKAKGIDINLSVQHILNCGNVGSCYGGSIDGAYQWIHKISELTGNGISYETANPYIACSHDSKEGFCSHVDTTCTPENVARTCSTFSEMGGHCSALSMYPNATIAEYGSLEGADAMAKEIYLRGPIACGIDAGPTLNYTSGVINERGSGVDHVVSVVGWGIEDSQEYWHVRNSWGEYWGEMGYLRVAKGNNALFLESQCSWATLKAFTETNYHCFEGGENCAV